MVSTVSSLRRELRLLRGRKRHVLPSMLCVALMASSCFKRSPSERTQSQPKHGAVVPASGPDKPEKKVISDIKCDRPRLDVRMQISNAIRNQPGMAGKAALVSSGSSRSGSLRPVFVDEANADSLARQAPSLADKRRQSDRSITAGARWIPTCDPTHPFALLRDVDLLKSKFPTNLNQLGRSLEQMYRDCGPPLGWIPQGQREGRVVAHRLSEDRSRCTIEVRGSDDAARDNKYNDHVIRVMRSRIRNGQLEFRVLTYWVPEQDWPYIAEVVRESADSFETVFD